MKNILITIAVALLSLTYSSNSFALGKMGHKLACQIAYEFLPAGTRSEVDKILASLPEEHVTAINKYNYITEDSKVTFSTACTWADAVKNEKKYKKFKSWHYININRSSDEIAASTCLKRCVTVAIPHHATQLTRGGNKKKKAEALMFLGHWVGDIHQPLHCGYKKDAGGNAVKLRWKHQHEHKTNLHKAWDTDMIKRKEMNFTAYANTLEKNLKKEDQEKWQKDDPTVWMKESRDALTQVYDYEGKHLDDAYYNKNIVFIDQRLTQASVRLAALFNSIFV